MNLALRPAHCPEVGIYKGGPKPMWMVRHKRLVPIKQLMALLNLTPIINPCSSDPMKPPKGWRWLRVREVRRLGDKYYDVEDRRWCYTSFAGGYVHEPKTYIRYVIRKRRKKRR